MFIGAINATLRSHFKRIVSAFESRPIIVGCSGNFTFEAILTQHGKPAAIHSNDVSLYSCLAGAHFTGREFRLDLVNEEFGWVRPWISEGTTTKLATVMALLDMARFFKRNNPHRQRMFEAYRTEFGSLVEANRERIAKALVRVDSFFAGDVADHFQAHLDDPGAVFCCFAPTYAGGYERMYKAVEALFDWDRPQYRMLDEPGRDALLANISARDFVWYDDRPGLNEHLVVQHRRSGARTVYLYSNMLRTALFRDHRKTHVPRAHLAGPETVLNPDGVLRVHPISTGELAEYKDMFLSKRIDHSAGTWAFQISVDGVVVGFMEFAHSALCPRDHAYLKSDFVVAGTRYPRLSKLPIILAQSGEMRRLLERITEVRKRRVMTLVFTDKPVSMKYRGLYELARRGTSGALQKGRKYLLYESGFNALSFQETYSQWMARFGTPSSASTKSLPA